MKGQKPRTIHAKRLADRALELRQEGLSASKIARQMSSEGHVTAWGTSIKPSYVRCLFSRLGLGDPKKKIKRRVSPDQSALLNFTRAIMDSKLPTDKKLGTLKLLFLDSNETGAKG